MSDAERGALGGVRVLDLGHGIAGPFAARLLGDLGADVVKVEPRSGDVARRLDAIDPDADTSPLFSYLNWNKRGVVLDLRDESRRDRVEDLVRWADIVFESFRPGRLAEWGLDFGSLREWNSGITLVSVTNFGQHGPRAQDAATDLTLYALGGVSSISGFADPAEPIKHGLRQSLYGAGMTAAYAALVAHRHARATATAQHVDVSMQECVASELVTACSYYTFAGAVQGRHPRRADPLEGLPLRARRGFVSFQVNDRSPATELARVLGNDLLPDPAWSREAHRVQNAEQLRTSIEASLGQRDAKDWFLATAGNGLLSGVVQGAEDLLDCPHLAARNVFRSVPGTDGVRMPLELAHYSRTPASLRRGAPRLGEHDDAVFAEVAAAPRHHVEARRSEQAAPLAGIRVVELASLVSVPYVGALLADLGAEVIKVEGPSRPDPLRYSFGPFVDNDPGAAPWNRAGGFHMINRGKRSFACDVKTDMGKEMLRELIATSDVVIENFAPGVLARWGLPPEKLIEDNPRLVILSNSGFGASGPWSQFKAQGTTLEVTMGAAAYTGYPGGDPLKAGQSYPDFLACWSGMLAVLAALHSRDRDGHGQWIDQGMYQIGAAVIPEALLAFQLGGADPERAGAADFGALVSGVFASGTPESWVAVTLQCADDVARLATVIGRPLDHRAAASIEAALASWIGGRSAEDAEVALRGAGIAAGTVLTARGLVLDEHLRARGFFEAIDVDAGQSPERLVIGRPFTIEPSGGIGAHRRAPHFGEDNHYVVTELLGRDLETALAAGAVSDRPLTFPSVAPTDFDVLITSGRFETLDRDYVDVCRTGASA